MTVRPLPAQTLNAIAVILAQSPLCYNQDGKVYITLKLLLGQKNTLCKDQHPFSNTEILHVTAHEELAVYLDQNCHSANEILVTLSFDPQQQSVTLHKARNVSNDANIEPLTLR